MKTQVFRPAAPLVADNTNHSSSELIDAPISRTSAFGIVLSYLELVKPRIMTLLLITTLAASLIAASTRTLQGNEVLRIIVLTLIGGALASGGASALNHYIDRDIDGLMERTKRRPLPSGRLQPQQVLIFGLLLSISSFAVFALWVNMLSAILALLGNAFYVFVYTSWLKRVTPQNIVIGGAAGAIPPLVGWAAVCNDLSTAAFLLFTIIVLWTPPHFWSLALLTQKDYSRAHIPMLPVVGGMDKTRWNILLYTLILVASTLLLSVTGAMGVFYLISALGLGALFVLYAARLLYDADPARAKICFLYSNMYLALLFATMVIDRLIALS